MSDLEWTDARVAKLCKLWALGMSSAQIGREMGVSKNAVIGKKGRLRLPGRASPIRRSAGIKPAKRRRRGPTLPPLTALAAMAATPLPDEREVDLVEGTERRPPMMHELPASVSPPDGERPRKSTACCWPIGEPRTKDFRLCEAAGVPGRPYCAEHCERAYVPQVVRSAANIAADEARRTAAHARMAASGGFSVGGFRPDWTV